VAALHADIGDWARRAFRDGGLEFEYVLTVARRAG
jgi:hypothetical protein